MKMERDERPWGVYEVLAEGDGYKVKRIEVRPGHRLSLQMHESRTEHWIIVLGEALVTIGDQEIELGVNEDALIPVRTKHRVMNIGEGPLIFIEVQCGSYLGEDDITRFEDHDLVLRDISGVVQVAHEAGFICKVIIETALLSDDEKVTACMISKAAGADFVKTSTGFSKGGATVADIALMRRVVGGEMGVKASGGVRDLKQAQEMIRAGATRIGASVGVKIVQEITGAQHPVNGHTGQSY